MSVQWPDNKVTILENIPTNQKLTLSQSDAALIKSSASKSIKKTLFTDVRGNVFDPHHEDDFNDFNQERLITRQLSKEGPALATGDVNNDGHEDIFLGGAAGQAGNIYLHQGEGRLTRLPSDCFKKDADFEDTSATFFDADGDGDLDLAVGSGGNVATEKDSYVARLYINNGKGQFTKSVKELPSARANISVISPHDFDGDGDADLFVGSRSVPGVFGVNPKHLLLINDGKGLFTDGTERYAYELKDAGMITDAEWVDMDGDSKKDLVTVSDWGTAMILKNSGRRLQKLNSNLDSLTGWWSELEFSDLDGDGDQDLVLGNAGLNIPYPGSKEKPMKLWINDFDENGTIEQITTAHHHNGDYPIHMRKELTAQLPGLKKQNLKATDYSKRNIIETFKPEQVNNSVVKTVNTSESIIAVNEGNGQFKIIKLPYRVQWSCVCGISCDDVNGDGNLDLVMGGNFFEVKPQFSRQDASYGHVLLGDGKLGFDWVNYSESGFFVREEIRELNSFVDKNGRKYMVAAINNGEPRVFQYNKK
jgi:hypothetical protein